MSPVKRICVFEHSVMTNFNWACPAIQRGQGPGFLSEGSSWLTACMSEQRRFWWDCADAINTKFAWRGPYDITVILLPYISCYKTCMTTCHILIFKNRILHVISYEIYEAFLNAPVIWNPGPYGIAGLKCWDLTADECRRCAGVLISR